MDIININKEDFKVIKKGIFKDYNSPYSYNIKLYKITAIHTPTQITVSGVSKVSFDDSLDNAINNLNDKILELITLGIQFETVKHLFGGETQLEYKPIRDLLSEDANIPTFKQQ